MRISTTEDIGHTRRGPRIVLGAGTALLLAIGVGVGTDWIGAPGENAESLVLIVAMTYFLGLGFLILSKADGNRVGWVFSAMAIGIAISGLAVGIGDRGYPVFYAVGGAFWLTSLGAASLLFLWFPTGRPPSRRWLSAQHLIVVSLLASGAMGLLTERLCVGDSPGGVCLEWIENPIGIAGLPNPEYSGPAISLLAASYLVAILSLGFRYRAADRTGRLQLKWFLLAGSGLLTAIAAEVLIETLSRTEPPNWVGILATISILSIPLAATIAITRYRLYDIERIISRTVSYALVAGLLALVFSLGVVLVPNVLPTLEDSPALVAASTLTVAALFDPLRKRIRSWVDRRFNRSRYDAEKVIDEFTRSLRNRIDPDVVVNGWVGVVSETMQPSAVSVWVSR